MMTALSKSKLIAHLQCAKKLWLEVHHPERGDISTSETVLKAGDQVGDVARKIFDPKGKGVLINPQRDGFETAFTQSADLLETAQPIFEAGFSAQGATAFADVMLPVRKNGKRTWRMIEVKSSTEIKDYYLDDIAIQSFVARATGVPLTNVTLAYVDNSWVYPGGSDFRGLLKEIDLTKEAFSRDGEVREWIASARVTARKRKEPDIAPGRHCTRPYPCSFRSYCQSCVDTAEYPVTWLPKIRTKKLKALIEDEGISDMRDVPDDLLNETQIRVKSHTLKDTVYFDAIGAATDLKIHKRPTYFLDFETIFFPVPIWKGTRPYQQIPFQYSLHFLSRTGTLSHKNYLDLSGKDPSRTLAQSLIRDCGKTGPIFAYNAGFEAARLKELAQRFASMRRELQAIIARLVDLLPIVERHFYHPSQQGSWSIKKVLPAIAPDLRYDQLEGVKDGGMAMKAYCEAINPTTSAARKAEIEKQLIEYCRMDTYAMVRLSQFLQTNTA